MRGILFGVGINDADYFVTSRDGSILEPGKKGKITWRCPYYVKWRDMLRRSYDPKFKNNNPHYAGVTTCAEWHRFSTFKTWMLTQDWEGNHLDKDLLVKGNKEYGPSACCFVSQQVNNFFTDSLAARGEWAIGVHKVRSKYRAYININAKRKHLGYFNTQEEAYNAWVAAKKAQAEILAAEETDERISKALLSYFDTDI